MTTEKGARTMAKLITEGKIPLQFIGRKSFLVLKQEIFSLVNRYNPKTMTQFELNVYAKDVAATVEGILRFMNEKNQDKLFKMFTHNYLDGKNESLSKREEFKSIIDKTKKEILTTKP